MATPLNETLCSPRSPLRCRFLPDIPKQRRTPPSSDVHWLPFCGMATDGSRDTSPWRACLPLDWEPFRSFQPSSGFANSATSLIPMAGPGSASGTGSFFKGHPQQSEFGRNFRARRRCVFGHVDIMAASLAALHRARRYVLFLIAVTVIALMIAYTIPPVSWVVAHTPFLKSMKNGRFIFVASFGIAAMAGLGISILQESETALIGRKRKYARGLVGVAFAGVIGAISRLQLATQVEATLMRRPSFSVLLSCAAVAILACALSGRMKKPLFEAITLSFVVFDLLTFSYGFTGFSSTRSIYSAAPVFDFLSKNADVRAFG